MFDQSYGLRFDIYERIILAEDLPGIEELEEVELIPHIQVISQEEQATLRGHLLVAGVYKGDSEEGESEPLEHWIPVEITVPLNRVSSLEDIAVEIENFDVDLLSKRSLNITGVLSLKGIHAAVLPVTNEHAWNEEEITVVHAPEASSVQGYDNDLRDVQQTEYQTDNSAEYSYPLNQTQDHDDQEYQSIQDNSSIRDHFEAIQQTPYPNVQAFENQSGYGSNEGIANLNDAGDAVEQELHRDQASQEIPSMFAAEQSQTFTERSSQASNVPESNSNVWNFERVEQQKASDTGSYGASSGIVEERQEDALSEIQTAYDELEASSEENLGVAAVKETAALPDEPLVSEEPPAKQEMKVALSTKNSTVDNAAGSIGLSSLLQAKRTVQEQEITVLEAAPVKVETEHVAGDDVQWKSLFLGSRQEETPFRKVRLCIVQREETIDAIAERYQLSPRELLLYNRLSEQSIEEGQVLYIP
ncbi:LysM peptidoglycan-binding domain-containing protein [Paenibacillus dakarensis]|uniref:LysM peptidoglycan-binding domain-containing protein n=1 Tax=Paenibacillus dakarensis TaxID=1527293 RepID=UPI0006D58861|nr:LysM peptidoglycan-binding domain-containing protein [Paenibacillus dakarensis]